MRMRIIIYVITGATIIAALVFIATQHSKPIPDEPYDDAFDQQTLALIMNEYAERYRAESIETTNTAEQFCGPRGALPELAETESPCTLALASASYAFTANGTPLTAGFIAFSSASEASAQLNDTFDSVRFILTEQLVPHGEIENPTQIVRGQLGPTIDEARFLKATLNDTYRFVTLLRADTTLFFVIEDTTEDSIKRYYYDAFDFERRPALLDAYNLEG